MELRTERAGASDDNPGMSQRRGISANWLSVPTVKVNVKDWKSMDALERAEAAAASREGRDDNDEAVERRWTGEDAGTSEGDLDGAGALARGRKRPRAKEPAKGETVASLQAIQAALAHNRQLLLQKRQAEEAAERERLGGALQPPSSAPYGYGVGRAAGSGGCLNAAPAPETTASPADVALSGASVTSVTLSGNPAEAESLPRPPPRQRQREASSSSPTVKVERGSDPSSAHSADVAEPTGGTLDSCGRAVMQELRVGEARQYASLKELEKLILRRLPAYAVEAQKMKDPARKNEAVTWFRQLQKELKLWLIQFGCTIDPTGVVTFPS